jgi:predicted DsbA family dithiol-disulfide isomerase
VSTIVVYSDLRCPFAHVAVHRLHETRAALGLVGAVHLDHHAFPLELIDGPHSRVLTDSEVAALGRVEPAAGWQMWSAPDWAYPDTVLLAAEAVHAAKEQGLPASEQLDRALRRAFWAESRSIHHRSVILEVAAGTGALDVDALADALDRGRCRAAVIDDWRVCRGDAVELSPHLFLPDGTDVANPGMEVRFVGEPGKGFPIVECVDPGVYERILRTAAAASPR